MFEIGENERVNKPISTARRTSLLACLLLHSLLQDLESMKHSLSLSLNDVTDDDDDARDDDTRLIDEEIKHR